MDSPHRHILPEEDSVGGKQVRRNHTAPGFFSPAACGFLIPVPFAAQPHPKIYRCKWPELYPKIEKKHSEKI
jgi:hypothetical protein